MSKSIGNVVEALALTEKYGNDAFRYFVMREMPFGLDASFSEEAFVGRLNADLANDLGNLVSRATTLITGNVGGAVPAPGVAGQAELAVRAAFDKARDDMAAAMEDFAFHRALTGLWEFIGVLNRYVDSEQPWTLARDSSQRARLETVLATLAEALRCLGIVLEPFLPDAAARIRQAVGQSGPPTLADAEWGRLTAGTIVEKVPGLFPRVDVDGKRAARGTAPSSRTTRSGGAEAAAASQLSIDEFSRLDLRVAEVRAAEAVPKSKKLLKLTLWLGTEERTVVAGIAEHYTPDDLVGKRVVIVANLQPAKLMGIESNGMVLAGSTDGRLAVLTPDRDLPPGARVT